jgi:hypothetical protein
LKDQRPVTFAIHGFVEFKSLADLFPYIESRTQRWNGNAEFDVAARRDLGRELLRRGIESRVISMADERPLETLITHTRQELEQALARVTEPMPPGYAEEFLAVQEKWKHAVNCWSGVHPKTETEIMVTVLDKENPCHKRRRSSRSTERS